MAVVIIRIAKKIKYIIDTELICSLPNDIREKRNGILRHRPTEALD